MSAVLVEAILYLLLLFTPLAFGGVEGWALGVFQILTGLLLAAWALGEGNPFRSNDRPGMAPVRFQPERRVRVLWICIGLFVLLVLLQLAPLPPGIVKTLSPATWRLYADTLPGYADGEGFRSGELPQWLLESHRNAIPESGAAVAGQGAPVLPLDDAAYTVESGSARTLSVDPYLTRDRLTLLLCLIAVFAVVTGHVRTRSRFNRLLAVSIGSVVLVSLLGMLQKLAWNGKLYWVREGDYTNVFGPFVNRNNYAALAVTVLPLAICLAFRALARYRRAHREALPILILNSLAAVILSGGILYSLSRGGMLAATLAVAAVGVLLFYFGKHTTELAFLAGLFLITGLFLIWIGSDEVIERVETISEAPRSPSLEMRFTAWDRSLGLVGENWLVGTGLGTFRFAFMRYAPPGRSWWTTAHNEFIEVFTDTGLTGGIIAMTGLAAFLLAVMRPRRFSGRSGRYAFVGLVAGLLALLAHSNVTSNLQIPANALLAVVMGGALLNHVRLQGLESSRGDPTETPAPADDSGRRRRRKRHS